MEKRIGRDNYKKDLSEEFLSAAIQDLKQGLTTYVYKEHILDELKKIFKDLDIARSDFYWRVRNKEVGND